MTYFTNLILLFAFIVSDILIGADNRIRIIEVKPDNDDNSLQSTFRTWYRQEFRGIDTAAITKIEVRGDGWQGGEFVLPVYSYNGYNWHRLTRDEIFSQTGDSDRLFNYTIIKKFDKQQVSIARYYPYDTERLDKLEARHSFKKNCRVVQIGKSGMGRPIKMFILTDNSVPINKKKAIWIHSRTHPSETGSSFMVEGLIDYILKKKKFGEVDIDLKKLVFYIVPMLNIDGVAEGNGRVTPLKSIDLEREWRFQNSDDKSKISDSSAIEARVINNTIIRLISEGNDFIFGINLHSTNSEPEQYPFIFTNFSRPLPEHGAEGDSMFIYHLRFAHLINNFWCPPKVKVITSYVPSRPMNQKTYPESWWWVNYREKVVAFTFETAATHLNCNSETVTYRDNYSLGEAMAKSIQKYHEIYINNKYLPGLSEYDIEKLKKNYINPK
jgi:hypothetical protein